MHRQRSRSARSLAVLVAAMLQACGGGESARVDLSTESVAFLALVGDQLGEWRTVDISWSGPGIVRVAVETAPGQVRPHWLATSLSNNEGPVPAKLDVIRSSLGSQPVGVTSGVLRVYALSEGYAPSGANVVAFRDLFVSLEVLPLPVLSPSSVELAWLEAGVPAPESLAVERDPRVQIGGVGVDAEWVFVGTSGGAVTISGNAASRALSPGTYAATLTVTFTLGPRSRDVTVPISAEVSPALAAAETAVSP